MLNKVSYNPSFGSNGRIITYKHLERYSDEIMDVLPIEVPKEFDNEIVEIVKSIINKEPDLVVPNMSQKIVYAGNIKNFSDWIAKYTGVQLDWNPAGKKLLQLQNDNIISCSDFLKPGEIGKLIEILV